MEQGVAPFFMLSNQLSHQILIFAQHPEYRKMKKIVLMGIPLLLIVLVITIYVCNRTIQKNSETYIYSTVSDIPYNKVGLLLGTSPKLKSGKANLYSTIGLKLPQNSTMPEKSNIYWLAVITGEIVITNRKK